MNARDGTFWVFFILALLAVFLPGAGLTHAARAVTALEAAGLPASRIRSFADLPPGLAPALARAFQDELSGAYHLRKDADQYQADNPAQGMHFTFTQEGFRVRTRPGSWEWAMTLGRIGYAGDLKPVPAAQMAVCGHRLQYRRGPALTEWYLNTVWGLEQGFTLSRRPPGLDAQPSDLVLELTLAPTLKPRLEDNTLLLCDGSGLPRARYTGLYAHDAEGRALPARMMLEAGKLRILVDDRAACYPVTIDPWVQQVKLTAVDGEDFDYFGYSVAVSGDTVVVGAYGDDIGGTSNQGSAYVFEKPAGGWADITESAKLTASDAELSDFFGTSVAAGDDIVVVGADGDSVGGNTNQGSAYVFIKPVGGWVDKTETAKLTASDGAAQDHFGGSVAVSGDTVVVGAFGNDSYTGAAYVFNARVWVNMTETAKLTASDSASGDRFGSSVAVSGGTVAVGAEYDDDHGSFSGTAYVFERPGGGWADVTQTAKLTAADGDAYDYFGCSVAVDGDTVAVGAFGVDGYQGLAYVFEKSPGGWTDMTETAKLTAGDGAGGDYFGVSLAVSRGTVVVGALSDDIGNISDQGSAYVFERPAGGWADMTEAVKLTAADGAEDDFFGYSVALCGDTVVVGAYKDDDNGPFSGSAYVFGVEAAVTAPSLQLLLLQE